MVDVAFFEGGLRRRFSYIRTAADAGSILPNDSEVESGPCSTASRRAALKDSVDPHPCPERGAHRPAHRGNRARRDVAELAAGGSAVRRGAAALCLRPGLDLAVGIGDLLPCRIVHAGGGMDPAAKRACARRCVL